jgi:signal transduction histidine kinase
MSSRWRDALRHALALRLGLWYAGLFAVSAAALLLATYVLLGRALANQDHDVLASMLTRYASEYQRAGLPGLRRMVELDASEGRHERLLVRVAGRQAELIYFAQPPGWSAFDLSRLDGPEVGADGWATIANPRDRSALEVGTAHLGGGVIVQVGRSSHVRDELLANFRARAFIVGAILAVIAALGAMVIASAALAPVRSMAATASTILQTRRFDARVPVRGTADPLDRLGARINEMLAEIAASLAGMRGALDNVAHDLRTPLTRFRNVAEAALTSGEPAKMHEGLITAVEEADRLGATLTALMDISEAETGTMRLTRTVIPVAQVVEEAASLHQDEAEERGIAIEAAIPTALTVFADHTRLRQVLSNLVENAVKYTAAGGRVTVTASGAGGDATIVVADTGVGIAARDLPLIWDRLYRADPSRSARGLGLGLSLVKAVVDAHGGRVAVSSTPGEGSRFSVTLPTGDAGAAAGPPPC